VLQYSRQKRRKSPSKTEHFKTAVTGSSQRSARREFHTDGPASRESTFCKLSSCSRNNIHVFGAAGHPQTLTSRQIMLTGWTSWLGQWLTDTECIITNILNLTLFWEGSQRNVLRPGVTWSLGRRPSTRLAAVFHSSLLSVC